MTEPKISTIEKGKCTEECNGTLTWKFSIILV